jgi:tRNA-Thr(GGU) m(6)t(6)A37 methyltransferase TsaA
MEMGNRDTTQAGLMKEVGMAITMNSEERFDVSPVGYVRREDERTVLEILPAFIPALTELEHFSHVQILWWFSACGDRESRKTTQFDEMPFDAPRLGVFACRAPKRPNPIGLTTARIAEVDRSAGRVVIGEIDAFDGTPILDLKGYLPHCDRVKNVDVPEWASHWPQWLAEEGLGVPE